MSRLMIRRAGDTAGVFRRMAVELDGHPAARLRPRQTKDLPVGSGEHVVQARMDWTASAPLAVICSEDSVTRVEVSMPWSALWRMLIKPKEALICRIVS